MRKCSLFTGCSPFGHFPGNFQDSCSYTKGSPVRSVHKDEDLMPAARKLALEFATQTSAISIAMIRQMMWKMLGADHPMEAHKVDSRGIFYTGKSADANEGVMSFLEKRPPEFPGKVSSEMPEFFPWWQTRKFE